METLQTKTEIIYENIIKILSDRVREFEILIQIHRLIQKIGMIVMIVKNGWFCIIKFFVFFIGLVKEVCVCVYHLVLFTASNVDGSTTSLRMKELLNHYKI